MADVKISDMTEASSAGDNDYLMIVQGGASKKIKASQFVRAGEQVSDAQTLDGHTPDEFLGATATAADSQKLGGHPASDFAKTSDIPALSDPTWCAMKFWYHNIEDLTDDDATSQSLRALNYVVCDGRQLSVSAYQELHGIIGYKFTPTAEVTADNTKFRIPDMRGCFPLGANVSGAATPAEINTQCLPTGLYNPSGVATDEWTAGGQWRVPKKPGARGGSFEVTQESEEQMYKHKHTTSGIQYHNSATMQGVSNNGSGAYAFNGNGSTDIDTDNAGGNVSTLAKFPQDTSASYNSSLLSVQRFVTFCYIMKLKP